MSAEERAAKEATWWEQHNAARRSAFTKSDEAPTKVHEEANLADAWARDRSLTNVETAPRRCRCLDGDLAKISEEWSLSGTSAAASRDKVPWPGSTLAAAAVRMT